MLYRELLEKRVVVPETYLLHMCNLDIRNSDYGNGYVIGRLMSDDGTLAVDSTYTLTCMDFGNAFKTIFSDEFIAYCKLVNECADALYERENKREELVNFISGILDYNDDDRTAYDIVHEYDVACTECSTLHDSRIEDKNEMIDKIGWSNWVDVCRLYETLFEIPRENL